MLLVPGAHPLERRPFGVLRMCHPIRTVPIGLAFASLLLASARAQCTLAWQGGFGCPGAAPAVASMTWWDPDGPGPLPGRAVLGGLLRVAGNQPAHGLASWNPSTSTFDPIVAPAGDSVELVAALPTGELAAVVVASVPGQSFHRVLLWNGTSWTVLGPDFAYASILSMVAGPNGELVIGGQLQVAAGGANLGGVAAWSGTAWVPVGGGVPGIVQAMTVRASGELVVGGAFSSAGSVNAANVAQWDGVAWQSLGTGLPPYVRAVQEMPNGLVFAGPSLGGAGLKAWDGIAWSTIPGVAIVNCLGALGATLVVSDTSGVRGYDTATATWVAFGTGPSVSARSLLSLPNGGFLAAGQFGQAGTVNVASVAQWTGSAWRALADGPRLVACVAPLANGTFAVGGGFTSFGNLAFDHVAAWNGSTWVALGTGLDGAVADLVRASNGELLAGGGFTHAGTTVARGVARWNGAAWTALGSGVQGSGGAAGAVSKVLELPNGSIVVGGAFATAGGVAASNVAVWNGSAWSALGAGLPANVVAMAALPNGDVVATTFAGFNAPAPVWRWNGTAWTTLFVSAGSGASIAVLPSGDLAIGGTMPVGQFSQGYVELVDGQGFPVTNSFTTDLYTQVQHVRAAPDGGVLAFGSFHVFGGVLAPGFARIGAPAAAIEGTGVTASAFLDNGDLLCVGPTIAGLDGGNTCGVARLAASCPAQAVAYGSGCAGSGGANVLTSLSLPWLGATSSARATGMPTTGLAVAVRGLGAMNTPLAAILPQGGAGCALLVMPDLLGAYVLTGGDVTTNLVIPQAAALAQQSLREQVVALAIDASGAITALTSTNALTLTIGVF